MEIWHQIRFRILLIIQYLEEIVDLKVQMNDVNSGMIEPRIETLYDVKMELRQIRSTLKY